MENVKKQSKWLENLYTFDNNSKCVRFFMWVYGKNPRYIFSGMCPFFWTLVVTVLFFPLILIIKLFGKTGTKFLSYLESYNRNSKEKKKQNFLNRIKQPLTPQEAYKIKRSKCFDYFYYDMTKEEINNIYDKSREWAHHLSLLSEEKYVKQMKFDKKVETIKESKVFVILAQIITFSIGLLILFGIYYIIFKVDYPEPDWEVIKQLFLFFGVAIGGMLFLISLYKYLFLPIIYRLSCIKLPSCNCKIFKIVKKIFIYLFGSIGTFFYIIGNMIYVTYKKNCPIITWKD